MEYQEDFQGLECPTFPGVSDSIIPFICPLSNLPSSGRQTPHSDSEMHTLQL